MKSEVFIALLRGINVSGQKPVLMAELQKLFVKLGYQDAKTFIQSGNVVFSAPGKDAAKLAGKLEAAIAKAFGFDVPVIVRSREEWKAVLAANPYAKRKPDDGGRVYLSFLESAPAKAAATALEGIEDKLDAVKVRGREVYMYIRGGHGKSVFSNNFVEKKLGVRATTRNLESTLKLLALAETL
jgi:uncharacterized protein (DUF1697 family)